LFSAHVAVHTAYCALQIVLTYIQASKLIFISITLHYITLLNKILDSVYFNFQLPRELLIKRKVKFIENFYG